jgi:hypothetical protein
MVEIKELKNEVKIIVCLRFVNNLLGAGWNIAHFIVWLQSRTLISQVNWRETDLFIFDGEFQTSLLTIH